MTDPTTNDLSGGAQKLPPVSSALPRLPRRRRRWQRRLLIVATALFLIIALLPRVLSTGIGRNIVVGQINDRIAGQAALDRLTLRWFGSCTVGDVRLQDLAGRMVLSIDNVNTRQGLLSTILSGGDFENVQAQGIQAAAYLAQDNTVSLTAAVSPPESSGRDHLLPAEILKDVLDVQAPAVHASWVGGKLQVHAAEKITTTRRADSARGIAQSDALHLGKFDLDGADGVYKITAELGGNLAVLSDVGLGWKGAEGTLTLSASGNVGAESTQIEFKTNVANARYPQSPGDTAAPINANINGKVALAAGKITGEMTLDGNIGSAKAEVQYNPPVQPAPLRLDDLMSAVLSGAAVQLPDVTVKGSARLDVAMIARAAPSALRVLPGRTLTGGELRITDLELYGGDSASVKGGVELTALSADDQGQKIELSPLTVNIDAYLKPGQGLEFRQAQLKSAYVQIDAQGNAAGLQARYRADLTEMKREFAQLFDVKLSDLGGEVSGEVVVTRTDDTHTEVALALNAVKFSVGSGEKRLRLDRASVSGEGVVTLKEGQVVRIAAGHSQLNVDGKVVGTATGWYDFATQGFDAQTEFERIELPHLASKLEGLGITAMQPYAGVLELNAIASRPAGHAVIASDGAVRGSELRRDGQVLGGKEVTLRWTKANYEAKSQRMAAEKIEIVSRDVSADLKVAFTPPTKPIDLSAERLVAAALTGEGVDLPDVSVRGNIKANLAALAASLPQLLSAVHETKITSGTLQITDLQVAGGPAAALLGTVDLENLTIQQAGKTVVWEPLHADLDVALQPGKGLACNRADLRCGFAKLNGSGTPADFKLELSDADLHKARQHMGSFIAFAADEVQGLATGRVTLTRPSDDRINVTLTAAVEKGQYAVGERRLSIGKASLYHTGYLTIKDGQLQRITSDEFKADVDGKIAASGSGWVDLSDGLFDAKLDMSPVDLAFAGGIAEAWRIPDLKPYAGTVTLNADAKRGSADGMIISNGTLTANKVLIDEQEIVPGEKSEIVAKWSDLQFELKIRDFSAKHVQLDSAFAQLSVKDANLKLLGEPTATGRITCNAGLTGVLNAVGRAAKWDKIPAIAGQLNFDSHCETAGGLLTLAGNGKITDLAVGSGDMTVAEKQVTFDYQADLDHGKDSLSLRQLKLASQGLSVEATGQISELKSRCVVALGGSYDASWERVTTLLHEVVPSTVEMVALTGQTRSEFKLNGPLISGADQLVSPQLSGEAGLGWASAKLSGLTLGPSDLKTALRESRIDIPQTRIDASGGSVNIGGAIDLQTKEPTLRIPGEVQLIDKVAIDPAVARSLLSRINPIFVNMTSVEGLVSVRTQDLVLPFGGALKTASQGRGYLDLANLKVEPSGLLSELLKLAGPRKSPKPGEKKPEKETIQVSGVDFEIKDGRFVYQNFTMIFAEDFDLRFYGSVGFDDTLDLVVSVPVRQELLDRLKVGGDIGKALGLLGAARVDIPIVGTRTTPKLDFSAVDITKLLRPGEGLIPKLGDILGGGKPGQTGQGQPPDQEPTRRESPKRRSGR